jgi:hypothetical protein
MSSCLHWIERFFRTHIILHAHSHAQSTEVKVCIERILATTGQVNASPHACSLSLAVGNAGFAAVPAAATKEQHSEYCSEPTAGGSDGGCGKELPW